MNEVDNKMTQQKRKALTVRLRVAGQSDQPRSANYTNVGVTQGIAYLDVGFIEPALLSAAASTENSGHAASNGLDGALVARVAMPLESLARLHQQIQQVLHRLQAAKKPNRKEGE